MAENQINRAQILITQSKYSEAEKILKSVLSEDPQDKDALLLLSEVYIQKDDVNNAEQLIDSAISLDPSVSHFYYNKARVALIRDRYDDAELLLSTCIQLDPDDADYYALLANIRLRRKAYEEALSLANKALEWDAENILALNTRSTALLKLNRKDESFHTIEGALREDPNNSYTHANYGWNLLEKGDHKKALSHFREALKHNPDNEFAQAGMAEALKASNLFYRWFLRYSFWISNLTQKYQWGVFFGVYIGYRGLNMLARNNEALQPYLYPLMFLLAFLLFSTWIMNPLANLFLRLNKYGKHLLSGTEKLSSNLTGICLLIFVLGVSAYFLLSDDRYLSIAGFGFLMMLPCGSMFNPSKQKYSLVIYAAVMALVGCIAIATTFYSGETFNMYTGIMLFMFVAYQWVANFLIIRESNV